MQTSINISENIARIRKESRLTQADLADFLGVTKASVSKWETGQSYPDIELLPKIATFFGVTVDELIGYEPQMTKAGVKRECERLRTAFAEEPFEQAHAKCQQLVRDYYSCYPLLVQIATLYLNHANLVEGETRNMLVDETTDLCRRIRFNSSSSNTIRQAEAIEASCLLFIGKPQEAANLLGNAFDEIEMGVDLLLANAYSALGQVDEADKILQAALFQSLVLILNRLPHLALLHAADHEKLVAAHSRALAVIDAFEFESVYVNTAAVHITFATAYLMGGDMQGALDCLEDYERSCRALEFPLKLHGDAFFDKVEAWLEETIDTGTNVPVDEELIKKNMLESLTANPVFAVLADDPRFKRIVKSVEEVAR